MGVGPNVCRLTQIVACLISCQVGRIETRGGWNDPLELCVNRGRIPINSSLKARARKSQTTDGMAYHDPIDPRALRTSEATEVATQGVYRLSHAI